MIYVDASDVNISSNAALIRRALASSGSLRAGSQRGSSPSGKPFSKVKLGKARAISHFGARPARG